MSSIRRFFWGVIVFVAGALAIFYGVERLPDTVETRASSDETPASSRDETPAPPAPEVRPEPKAAAPTPTLPPAGPPGAAQNASLKINAAGLDIIKRSEGLRFEAYQSVSGRWFIGYGHSRTAQPGMIISEAEAEALLREDVEGAEASVKKLVTVPVNVNEFSAMVSLCYNLGAGNFGKSAVVREINLGNRQSAANAFRNHIRAGYQVLEHLKHRREEERTLFLTPA